MGLSAHTDRASAPPETSNWRRHTLLCQVRRQRPGTRREDGRSVERIAIEWMEDRRCTRDRAVSERSCRCVFRKKKKLSEWLMVISSTWVERALGGGCGTLPQHSSSTFTDLATIPMFLDGGQAPRKSERRRTRTLAVTSAEVGVIRVQSSTCERDIGFANGVVLARTGRYVVPVVDDARSLSHMEVVVLHSASSFAVICERRCEKCVMSTRNRDESGGRDAGYGHKGGDWRAALRTREQERRARQRWHACCHLSETSQAALMCILSRPRPPSKDSEGMKQEPDVEGGRA